MSRHAGRTEPRPHEVRRLDDEQLASLLEQRDFLLQSLEDLEAERAAGDIDEADYRALEEDYTRRAANVIRAIEARQARIAERRDGGRRRGSVLAWIAGVVVVGVVAGVLLGRATGSRGGGEATGDVRESTRTLLVEAQGAFAAGDAQEAVDLYGQALELSPGNVEALTYRGWLRYQALDRPDEAWADFDEAVAVDPEYPDVRIFRAVAFLEEGDADSAEEELAAYDAIGDQPPFAAQLLASFRLRERVAVARVEESGLLDPDSDAGAAEAGLTPADLKLAAEQLVETGRLEAAIVVIDAGLDAEPDDPGLLSVLGWIDALVSQSENASAEQREQLTERALDELSRAIDADPALPDPRLYRAVLLAQLGRPDEAAGDLEAFCAGEQPFKLQEYMAAAGLACDA